jgi:uncharacterized damage-inducible protein DinB
MSLSTLKSLFGQKVWANDELFAKLVASTTLPEDQMLSSIRTLNHIYVVDRIFRAHLAGEPRPFDATQTPTLPTLAQLHHDVQVTDAWYVQYVTGLSEDQLETIFDFDFTDGDIGRMSREEILLHVITHGAYHRGNVGQILKTNAMTPPRDLYTKFLHQSEPDRRAA